MKKYKIFLADANSTFVNSLEHKLRSDLNIEFIKSNHMMFHPNQDIHDISPDIISFDMVVPKNQVNNKNLSIDVKISNRLSRLGMPSGLSGYRYMISAVKLVLSNENALDSVTKILYPDIAKKHQSTPQRVEKAIRHAIKVTWSNNIPKNKDGYNFYVKDGRNYPTNTQFIAEMSRHVKLYPYYLTDVDD